MTARTEFDIDDAKSVAENLLDLEGKLTELDPLLGPILASFLPHLVNNPTGDKVAMLAALRAKLDEPSTVQVQQ